MSSIGLKSLKISPSFLTIFHFFYSGKKILLVAYDNLPHMSIFQNYVVCEHSFNSFREVSESEVRKVICESGILVKQYLDSLVPIITFIINKSLTTRVVPSEQKLVRVCPWLRNLLILNTSIILVQNHRTL